MDGSKPITSANAVPDQETPLVNVGDAPTGFGPDSWQNTNVTSVTRMNMMILEAILIQRLNLEPNLTISLMSGNVLFVKQIKLIK